MNLKNMPTLVNGEWIKVYDTGRSYLPVIKLADGTLVEHEPFPRDDKGRVCALDLSLLFESGKVFLTSVKSLPDAPVAVIEHKSKKVFR